jgi:hypothetical protein
MTFMAFFFKSKFSLFSEILKYIIMKRIKTIDAAISIVLIILFIILGIVNQDETFLIGYFVVGGWQVISMIVHAACGWFNDKGGRRNIYQWIVFCLIAFALLGFAAPVIFALLAYPMLFAAPFMAVYYTWVCCNEVMVKMKRPLALLK